MQGFFLLAFILQPPGGLHATFSHFKTEPDEERSGDVISLSGNMADESDH
jgi:hypothetical protein